MWHRIVPTSGGAPGQGTDPRTGNGRVGPICAMRAGRRPTIPLVSDGRRTCLVVDCLYWLRQGRHRGLRGTRGSDGERIELLAYLLWNIGHAITDLRPDGTVLCLADVGMSWSDNDAGQNSQERKCHEHFGKAMAHRKAAEANAAAVVAATAVKNDADRVIILSERAALNPVLEPDKIMTADSRLTLSDRPGAVEAGRWIEYMALCGSSSELSVGVRGIGPKTAAGIIESCDSLDDIMNGDRSVVPDKHADLIVGSQEQIRADIASMNDMVWNQPTHDDTETVRADDCRTSDISAALVHEALTACGMNSGHAAGLLGAVSIASTAG